MSEDWRTDALFFSLEERLKHFIVPDRLYLWNLVKRRLRDGEKELHVLPAIVKRGTVAIDVGANKGIYSYLLSKLCREVMAFEPNPKMYSLLQGAVPANVRTFEVALSNADGTADLILPIQRSGRYSNQGATLQKKKLDGDKEFRLFRVEQRRLDDYRFTGVSFIKIDVEGYELEVLEGAAETLRRERPTLLVEIEEAHSKRPMAEAFAAIAEYGYECFYTSTNEIRHISAFAADQTRSHTNNFLFFPVDG